MNATNTIYPSAASTIYSAALPGRVSGLEWHIWGLTVPRLSRFPAGGRPLDRGWTRQRLERSNPQ